MLRKIIIPVNTPIFLGNINLIFNSSLNNILRKKQVDTVSMLFYLKVLLGIVSILNLQVSKAGLLSKILFLYYSKSCFIFFVNILFKK